MRLIWTTDLHLNHAPSWAWQDWVESIASHGADGVVITGDISEGDDVVFRLGEIANSVALPIYFVLGNHDFYRSSIGATRQRVIHAAREIASLHYLTDCGPIALDVDEQLVLVGEDGWGDATEGDYDGSPIRLNDFPLIEDFRSEDPDHWKQHLIQLGSDATERLRVKLKSVPESAKQILIATHVPPFCEACWYEGKTTDSFWAPFFVCGQLGKLLLDYVSKHPTQQFTVLCGHTHHDGVATMTDNLTVYTGAAQYGRPAIEAMVRCAADQVTVSRAWRQKDE